MARVDTPTVDCSCVLLVEHLGCNPNRFFAANAVVTPKQYDGITSVPIWLLTPQ